MRKIGFILSITFVICAIALIIMKNPVSKKQVIEDNSVPEIDAFFALNNAPIAFQDVNTTAELRTVLGDYKATETPRIYVRNFPSDFSKEGSLDVFIRTLLPYILRQNEIQVAERNAFLKISDKINKGVPLTQKESDFFQSLVIKYEALNPDLTGQANTLFHRIDRMSPSLPIAQAIEATKGLKVNLNAPFDVFRWNKNKEYARVVYSDLAKAVEDYALELNRGLSYHMYHLQRSIYRGTRYELPGSVFTDGLRLYKIEDKDYADKIYQIFRKYKFYKLDFAKFKEGE